MTPLKLELVVVATSFSDSPKLSGSSSTDSLISECDPALPKPFAISVTAALTSKLKCNRGGGEKGEGDTENDDGIENKFSAHFVENFEVLPSGIVCLPSGIV